MRQKHGDESRHVQFFLGLLATSCRHKPAPSPIEVSGLAATAQPVLPRQRHLSQAGRRMKLYLDSADARQWALPAGCPPVQGVTTNPTLVMQAGLPVTLATYLQLVGAAGAHGMAALMLQLPSHDVGQAQQWRHQRSRCRPTLPLVRHHGR